MTLHELGGNYSLVGDMISFVTCAVLLVIIKQVLFYSADHKFSLLKRAVHTIMLGTMANAGFAMVCRYEYDSDFLIYLYRSVYHFCFLCCMYLFLLYLKRMLDVGGALVNAVTYFTRAFFVVCLILDILSPFTHFGLHKENGLWYDPIVSPYNMFYVYAMPLLTIMLIVYRERLIRSVRNSLIVTMALMMVIMTASGIANSNTFTSYTYVVPIIVVMMLLHSRPFNDKTGALSPESFDAFVSQLVKKCSSSDYMVLKLKMNQMTELPDELGKILNSFWHSSFRDALLFQLEPNLYVLTIPRNDRNGDTEKKIINLMENEFQQYYAEYQLKYKVIGLLDMDFIKSGNDIRDIINYMLPTMQDNTQIFADEKTKEQLKLIETVRLNLADIEDKSDLNDGRVLVYCQPIKNMQTGKFDTGEALMRLSLPEKGIIPPNVFIPLAERYGNVHSLTRIMLNKVCLEIKKLEEEGYSFNRISVNFTASEIMTRGFCHELQDMLKMHNVNPSRIGVELTESQNETDFNIVKEKISILRAAGMSVYLDDVGTGYSNLDRIVKYDVDVLKFDRFFLLEAEKNTKVASMMKYMSEAFKELNYKLLYEGVENEENESLCMSSSADYIQGFKYSKPLPIQQMREFFEHG